MIIENQEYYVNGLHYTVRSAIEQDAKDLSALRLQIDGETENLGYAFYRIFGGTELGNIYCRRRFLGQTPTASKK